jgi:hypothetical protein
MIKVLAWTDLEPHWVDLEKISEKILDGEQTDAFCSNLMINVLRKPYPNAELDQIMYNRCSNYSTRYELLKRFLGIQNEIETNLWVWEDVIQWNLDFNMFKLVSTRQKIYIKHKDKNLDPAIVQSYLKFLNALLNDKSITIPQFYIEASYYFNNIYLKNILRSLSINSLNPTTATEVNKVLDTISSINKWNPALKIKGLESRIINENIKEEIISKNTSRMWSIIWFEQALNDVINTFPQLRASNIETDESNRTARVIGALRIREENSQSSEWGAQRVSIPVIIDFLYKDWIFSVSSIRTPQNLGIDSILQNYMKTNGNKSLSELLYLIENSTWGWSQLTLCWIISSQSTANIVRCNETILEVRYFEETITFIIQKWVIVSWRSTNPLRKTYLDAQFEWGIINQDRLVWILKSLWEITKKEAEEWDTNEPTTVLDPTALTIIDKFKSFLWVTPDLVEKKNNQYVVEFTLKDIKFATVVDVKNNYKLSPLIVSVWGRNVTISSFSLSLINIQQKRINQFAEDPIEFIKSVDINRYNQIKRLQSGTAPAQ